MISARPRIVIVNASLGIREALADSAIDADIDTSTGEA